MTCISSLLITTTNLRELPQLPRPFHASGQSAEVRPTVTEPSSSVTETNRFNGAHRIPSGTILAPGARLRTRLANSNPLIVGRPIPSKIICGWSSCAFWRASTLSAASAITSSATSCCRVEETKRRKGSKIFDSLQPSVAPSQEFSIF